MVNPLNSLRTISLKTRVLVLVSLLIVVGIWGLAAGTATVLQADLEKMVGGQLSGTLDYVAADIDHAIQSRIAALDRLATTLKPALDSAPTELQDLLEKANRSEMPFSAGLMCTDRRGTVVAATPGLKDRLGTSIGDHRYFREIMAGAAHAVGKPTPGPSAHGTLIAVAVPLKDGAGKVCGVLVGASMASDQDLLGQLEQTRIGKTGYLIVASPRDKLIVSSSDRSRILTPMPARGVNPLLDRRLDEGYEGTGISVNSRGVKVLTLSRHVESTGWLVVAGIATAEAFAPIVSLRRQIYLGALLISLVVAAILYLVLRWQLSPLGDAAAAMRRMSSGEAPLAPIAIARQDEIGELVGNFNALVAERRRMEQRIRDLNLDLERRVAERTNELLSTNQKLEAEIGERKTAESSALDFAARLQVMTRRYVGAQEAEKRRLARELHDRVSSSLTAIGLNLGLIEKKSPQDDSEKLTRRLSDTRALLKDTMLNVREISHDLHPSVLDYGGVIPALEDYGRKFFDHTGITVRVSGGDKEIRLPAETEIALYRIAQEALTNCAKHADAKTVTIALNGDAEQVVFVITDDGIGFDLDGPLQGRNQYGLGLLSMRERAEAIGGRLSLESAPGRGMRIQVEIGA